MMKFNEFQKYEATLLIPYQKYFELIYETKYLIEARLSTGRLFVAHKSFYGCNRRAAVIKASDWYNSHLKAVLGNPHNTMFINDPLMEVKYDDDFVCTDLRNKYLDEDTTNRLLAESKGDLGREDALPRDGISLGSVKRLRKRKRKEERQRNKKRKRNEKRKRTRQRQRQRITNRFKEQINNQWQ